MEVDQWFAYFCYEFHVNRSKPSPLHASSDTVVNKEEARWIVFRFHLPRSYAQARLRWQVSMLPNVARGQAEEEWPPSV
jgi:hypothetical protein